MIVNLAERAHNHNWRLDPITRSLLDTDFYKLLMLQFIWKHFAECRGDFYADEPVEAAYGWRTAGSGSKICGMQLDHVRKLRFGKSELIWLAGNTFYGKPRASLNRLFLSGLRDDFELPAYQLVDRGWGAEACPFTGSWPTANDVVGSLCAVYLE